MSISSKVLLTASLATALLTGCAGDAMTSGSAPLLAAEEPLSSVARRMWESAPAGCEGLVDASREFALADGEPSLVAVLENGDIVCVDAYAAIDEELRAHGMAADRLWLGYVAALQEIDSTEIILPLAETSAEIDIETTAMGDPHPQPGDPIDGVDDDAQGDPHPQPGDPL